MNVALLQWSSRHPSSAGTPRGMVTVCLLDLGLVISGIRVYVHPDGKPEVTQYARETVMPDGQTEWRPVVWFPSLAIREDFSASVMAALFAAHPELSAIPASLELVTK